MERELWVWTDICSLAFDRFMATSHYLGVLERKRKVRAGRQRKERVGLRVGLCRFHISNGRSMKRNDCFLIFPLPRSVRSRRLKGRS